MTIRNFETPGMWTDRTGRVFAASTWFRPPRSSSASRRLDAAAVALTEVGARGQALDERVLRVLRTRWHEPALERAVVRFSCLGEHSRLWVSLALAGAACDRPHRPLYTRLLVTLVATEVVNALLKVGIDRPRPSLPGLSPLMSSRSAQSCPSAHAATSFAAARLLSRALPAPPVYLAAAAMALSRPYVGVHYPSDVLAGVALGTAVAGIGST